MFFVMQQKEKEESGVEGMFHISCFTAGDKTERILSKVQAVFHERFQLVQAL